MTIKFLLVWLVVYAVFYIISFLFLEHQHGHKFAWAGWRLHLSSLVVGTCLFAALISISYICTVIPWNYRVW